MRKKLTKFGNSLALIIDKPILSILEIDEKTQLKIETDGTRLVIEPVDGKKKSTQTLGNKKLQKIFEEFLEEYDEDLKKLAKD